MIKLSRAVVVEGKYDKIRLSSLLDCPIITTEGFGIYKNPEKLELIRRYAENQGIIILTDSDNAGRQIRNHLKQAVGGKITHIYVPEILGKERRKQSPSKSGMIGVEGMDTALLLEAFDRAGLTAEQNEGVPAVFTRENLFDDGLIGGESSKTKRKALLKELGLPMNLSTSALLDALNSLYEQEEYRAALERIE